MLKKILAGLLLSLTVLAVVISSRPDTFHYSRAMVISASPEKVFPHVNDLHQWEAWSPWGKLDPAMKKSYEGSASGAGAVYRWSGNHEVGEGSTSITESHPSDLIKMKLEFLKPFKGTNDVVFTFEPAGEQTLVTWAMSGQNNFISKAVGLFMNCEKMINTQFDQGLTQLKTAVEGGSK